MYARARQTGTQGFSIFIDPGREVKVSYLCLGDTFYARPGNCGPQGIQLLEVWHSTSCWRCCESRGFWAMHQVVRAYTCFTCLTFIDWSAFVGLGLVVGAVCLFCFCFLFVHWPICAIELSTDDQFSISSWLPLSLWRAQHSPKKKFICFPLPIIFESAWFWLEFIVCVGMFCFLVWIGFVVCVGVLFSCSQLSSRHRVHWTSVTVKIFAKKEVQQFQHSMEMQFYGFVWHLIHWQWWLQMWLTRLMRLAKMHATRRDIQFGTFH